VSSSPRGRKPEDYHVKIRDLVPASSIAAVDARGVVSALEQEAEEGVLYEPVMPWFSEGREVYRRSLILALDVAARRIFPESVLWVEHALSLGYKCRLEKKPEMHSTEICARLTAELAKVIAEDLPYRTGITTGSASYDLGGPVGSGAEPPSNSLDGSVAFSMGPCVPSTSWLEAFDLRPEGAGFVLRFPGSGSWPGIAAWEERPKLAREFDLQEKHGARLGVRTLAELNARIERDGGLEIVAMSHFYHEYRMMEIVMELESSFPRRRIVTIAGPSSSGKTTFTRLMTLYLRAQGFGVKAISVDNYFKDRDRTPRDSSGRFDFESLDALETDLFGEHISKLMEGEEVRLPRFDFIEGVRHDGMISMSLSSNDFLLIEGIHGLNDALTPGVDPGSKFRIYISALTQLNIDRLTRMSTSDSRLLRRMTRDSRTRGYSAEQTIEAWSSVRRGERLNIFPFQEMADAMFNSALPFELPVLKPFAAPLLASVPEGSPSYNTASRLMRLLEYVKPIDASVVPRLSLMREFIGGLLIGEEGH
jgi:uridine kinase